MPLRLYVVYIMLDEWGYLQDIKLFRIITNEIIFMITAIVISIDITNPIKMVMSLASNQIFEWLQNRDQ